MTTATFRYEGQGAEAQPKWLSFPCQWRHQDSGDRCRISINGQRNSSGATWSVTGPIEAPTVTPSVHCVGACHVYLRDGRFEHCGDYA
jgi:hypothetical protein